MEIRKFNSEELKDYEIVNESRGNRSGFKHDSVLFKGGYELARVSLQYYNRTWECYTYQTSMRSAVNQVLDARIERIKDEFKRANNIKRLTEKTKEQLQAVIDSDEQVKLYKLMYNELAYQR